MRGTTSSSSPRGAVFFYALATARLKNGISNMFTLPLGARKSPDIATVHIATTRRWSILVIRMLLPVSLLLKVSLLFPKLSLAITQIVPHVRNNAADIPMVTLDFFGYQVGCNGM